PLLDIQRGESQIPIVLIHPIGGGILCYTDLIGTLGRQQRIIGIHSPDPSTMGTIADLRDLAAHYVNLLVSHHRTDAYVLAGWSFGGLIALEMARVMNSNGIGTRVNLIDSHLPVTAMRNEIDDERNVMRW